MNSAWLLPLLLIGNAPQRKIDMYIGTYTSDEGSKGIYHCTLDPVDGSISKPALVAEAPNPSFLALHPSGRFLYAVLESTGGDLSSYRIGDGGALQHLNKVSFKGGGPCHVSVDPSGKVVFAAAYGQGSLASFTIREDGSLSQPVSVFQNEGSGPNKSRQGEPHMHAVLADPSSRFLYACDLGTDEVLVFRLDAATGRLTLAEPRAGKVPAGGGPRHLALHPNGRFAYVNNEMGNSVTVFSRDNSTGALSPVQTLSTLPEGIEKGNSTAEIVLHPSGKWLYVSNRGHDSIAVYAVGSDGLLKLIEIKPAGVGEPRGFDIDPEGKWLVVGGQRSNDLRSLKIDGKTGKLEPTPHQVALSKPVCVVFGRR